MSKSSSLNTVEERKKRFVPVIKAGALAAVVASVVNEILAASAAWFFEIGPEFDPLTPGAAAISTVTGLVLATVTMLVVMRFAKRVKPIYWGVATVALLVSFIPNVALFLDPEHIAGTTTAGILTLATMHVVAYAIAVPWIVNAADQQTGEEAGPDSEVI